MRLHPRRLVDTGDMYIPNAVLQSLVYCLPFRDLFSGLGHLVGQCEGGEAGGHATPLIDTTVRFLNEFPYKEKSSLTHQTAKGKVKEEKDGKKEDEGVHSLLSTHVYDAMKEKRDFIMRVRS
jgi:ubiquitin carboxyl-terminal hydrolase 10